MATQLGHNSLYRTIIQIFNSPPCAFSGYKTGWRHIHTGHIAASCSEPASSCTAGFIINRRYLYATVYRINH